MPRTMCLDPICTVAEVWCCSEHYLWQFLGWRHRLRCLVIVWSILRLLKQHKLAVSDRYLISRGGVLLDVTVCKTMD